MARGSWLERLPNGHQVTEMAVPVIEAEHPEPKEWEWVCLRLRPEQYRALGEIIQHYGLGKMHRSRGPAMRLLIEAEAERIKSPDLHWVCEALGIKPAEAITQAIPLLVKAVETWKAEDE